MCCCCFRLGGAGCSHPPITGSSFVGNQIPAKTRVDTVYKKTGIAPPAYTSKFRTSKNY